MPAEQIPDSQFVHWPAIGDRVHLVLLETSANQAYIFATNKLKENVGASQLTWLAGTQWVLEAVAAAGGPTLWDEDVNALRDNLLAQLSQGGIRVVVATSGKALLLVADPERGRAVIREATSRALRDAPGLDLAGVVGEEFSWGDIESFGAAFARAHQQLAHVRGSLTPVDTRFQRLPFVADCAASGDSATELEKEAKAAKAEPWSAGSMAKRRAAKAGQQRANRLAASRGHKLVQVVDDLEDDIGSWVAVIHADGNGLGKIFVEFEKFADATTADDYCQKLGRFSIALDRCTEEAFLDGLRTIATTDKSDPIGVVPLILGGDDLTVVCAGQGAIGFAAAFLSAFEAKTAADPLIEKIATKALGAGRLSSCAGVAIVKSHYPFHAAYALAEELLQSAKVVKLEMPDIPCSAIDFHVLYDSTSTGLNGLRRRQLAPGGERAYLRPYVLIDIDAAGGSWAEKRTWAAFEARVKALKEPDESDQSRRKLPNSQIHDLRAAIYRGDGDEQLGLVYDTYAARGLAQFTTRTKPPSLFFDDAGGKSAALVDAIEATEFL